MGLRDFAVRSTRDIDRRRVDDLRCQRVLDGHTSVFHWHAALCHHADESRRVVVFAVDD
jgi:hypothetical protein